VELSANPESGSVPFEVTLRAAAAADGGRLSYLWTVPGAEEAVRAGESYTTLITEPGDATFGVTVSNGDRRASDEVTVRATAPSLEPGNDRPVIEGVQVSPEEGTAPLEATFTVSASDPNDDPLTYLWDFGDGTIVEGGASVSHTYEEPSYYPVKVVVSDGRGGIASDETDIFVSAPPVTLNLDVSPEGALWEIANYSVYDDLYGVYEEGSGDATLELPAYDYYEVYVNAEGYESDLRGFDAPAGETVDISVVLEPSEPGAAPPGGGGSGGSF
jgi:PKD repeat protein